MKGGDVDDGNNEEEALRLLRRIERLEADLRDREDPRVKYLTIKLEIFDAAIATYRAGLQGSTPLTPGGTSRACVSGDHTARKATAVIIFVNIKGPCDFHIFFPKNYMTTKGQTLGSSFVSAHNFSNGRSGGRGGAVAVAAHSPLHRGGAPGPTPRRAYPRDLVQGEMGGPAGTRREFGRRCLFF